jgi:S-methylmethionine-dependent homocysteine/selenocysteine methylase
VLVNCTPAARTIEYVERLAAIGVPFGAYANAGAAEEGIGWGETAEGPSRYAGYAEAWVRAGATLVGGCCGTGPAHVRALGRLAAG